jgi:hypothetical protein
VVGPTPELGGRTFAGTRTDSDVGPSPELRGRTFAGTRWSDLRRNSDVGPSPELRGRTFASVWTIRCGGLREA